MFRLISAGTIEEIVYARQIYKQQQANIGYLGNPQRRYFEGVQAKRDRKGEIFGLTNLLSYQDKHIVLKDIVNKTNVAESKAGVEVVDIDVNVEEGDQLSGMNQLADMIEAGVDDKDSAKTSTKQHDPVQAILDGAGVEYSHFNDQVIGSSKVEDQLSRRAEQMDLASSGARVFSESQSQTVIRSKGELVVLQFHPPTDVMRRQFCSMMRWYGYTNATEFGLAVEKMTQAQRRECLDLWYAWRREQLAREPKTV